jgi:hypothetical protein
MSAAWGKDYRCGEAACPGLVRFARDAVLQDRLVNVARHYRSLAEIEQNIMDRRGDRGDDASMRKPSGVSMAGALRQL